MIFVNFKTYEEGTGKRAVELSRIIEQVAAENQIKIIPVVQSLDIKEITQVVKLEVWAQKVDPVTFGANTGSIIPEAVVEDGAIGTFLNHSENKFANIEELKTAVELAHKAGLKTLVFATDIPELTNLLTLKPTYIAYEPAELVGSQTTSVAESKPEIIRQAAELATNAGIPLIVGAGVKSSQDVHKSLELGAVGVAVASDIVKAVDPKKELLDLIEGFK